MRINFKKVVASILAIGLLLTSMPLSSLADEFGMAPTEFKPTVRAIEPPDWSVNKIEADTDYWPLAEHNILVEVAQADSIKNPTIEYAGSYNLGDREVIKIAYRTTSSANAVWQNLLLKFDSKLAKMIDWTNDQTGAWKNPKTNRSPANPQQFQNGIAKFASLPADLVGSNNVYGVSLNDAGYKNTTISAPMHFVLKSKEQLQREGLPTSIAELTQEREPVIQSRIVDTKYERVHTIISKHINSYSTYTSSTIIPNKNYRQELIPEAQQEIAEVWAKSQNTFITYNKYAKRPYVDLTIRHNKADLGRLAFNPIIGLRTVIEDKFFNVLAGSAYTKDDGTYVAEDTGAQIADVFILNVNEEPYGGSYENPVPNRRIPVLRNQINKGEDGLNFIQVVGSDYQKTSAEGGIKTQHNGAALDMLVNAAVATGGPGIGTVVRFYVNPAKFEKLVGESDLLDMSFYTTFTRQTKAKTQKETFSGTIGEDVSYQQGERLVLYPGVDRAFFGGSRVSKKITMEIGQRPHSVFFYSDTNELAGTSLYWKDRDSIWWTIPYDMTLKAGTPIRIYTEGIRDDANEFSFYRNKDVYDNNGNVEFTIQRDPGKSGNMQFMRFAESLKSPHVAKTQNEASIPEIFTTDTTFYGHTQIGGAIVRVRGLANDREEVLNQAYLSDGNDRYDEVDNESVIKIKNSQSVIVNKRLENGYEFSTTTAINPRDPLGAPAYTNRGYRLQKDMPIAFTTENYSINATEKLPAIIEQVQAKVTFDLNGGYLGDDENAEKAKNPIIKVAPLNENYRYLIDDGTNFPTAVVNNSYKANGFEGENRRMIRPALKDDKGNFIRDENGNIVYDETAEPVMASHTDQPLGKETYQEVFDRYRAQIDKRLKEAEALPTGVGAPNKIRDAYISAANHDKDTFESFIKKFYTDKGIDLTKSELWLREFPGRESQEEMKTQPPKLANKEFYGWTTKKVETVEAYNALEELTTEAQAKNTSKTYKFTEKSPILSEMTVYAFYGPLQSAVYNPEQKYDEKQDKQYIEAVFAEVSKEATEDITYKLVKKTGKDTEGNPIYEEIDIPVTSDDGKYFFDITGDSSPVKHKDEIFIKTQETGKPVSYSNKPIVVDKKGPTLGTSGNEINLVQDHFGYKVKISAEANDDAGILRLYAENDKANGYYKQDVSEKSAKLSESVQKQLGESKTFKVTAVDKFGNKTVKTKDIEAKMPPVKLRVQRPRIGDKSIFVQADPEIDLEITVYDLNNQVSKTITHTQKSKVDEITLNSPLQKRQKVKVSGTKTGKAKGSVTVRTR